MPNPRKDKIKIKNNFSVDFLNNFDEDVSLNTNEDYSNLSDLFFPVKLIKEAKKRKEEKINPNTTSATKLPKIENAVLPKTKTDKEIVEEELRKFLDEDDDEDEGDVKEETILDEHAPLISLKDVFVKYNLGKESEFQAIGDINIDIYKGEFIMLFGPSGCGKSTLMNVVAGLERPTKGSVSVDNQNILAYTNDEVADYHTDKIGMVFQAYNLIDTLSVEDNIALPQLFKVYSKKEKDQKVKELLERFSIQPQAQKVPSELSGGQQQRVGIARSLVNDPLIILADEPVGNLDSKSAEVVTQIFKNLNKDDGKTIIMVTHNPELLKLADRIYYLKDGKIIKEEVNNDNRPKSVKEKADKEESELALEIDMLSKSFAHLNKQQIQSMWLPLKAAAITDIAINKYSNEQVEKIKDGVKRRLMGLMNRESFFNFLDMPESQEGVGLDRRNASKLSDNIEKLINESKEIKQIIEAEDDSDFQVVNAMRVDILRHFSKDLLKEQVDILNIAIAKRIKNKVDKKKFLKIISTPYKKGGVGINYLSAKKMARELELLVLLKIGEKYKI